MRLVQIFNHLSFNSFIAHNYIYIVIGIAISILGFLLGSFGTVVVLRKEALIADGISHSVLPGIVLSFMIFKNRQMPILMLGAFISSGIMMIFFRVLKRYTKIKKDALLAILLSGFFGLGQVLLGLLNKTALSGKSGIDKFMFGQLAYVQKENIYTVIGCSIIIFLILFLFWKEIKLSTFDQEFYKSLGYNPKLIDILLTVLIIISIVIGLEMVGMILISALLVIPSVVARWCSDKFSVNFTIGGLIGLIAGISGVILVKFVNMPPGPAVVLFLSLFALIAVLFSPKKGYIVKSIKNSRQNKLLKKYHYLIHLNSGGTPYKLEEEDKNHLLEKGFIKKDGNKYILTDSGKEKACNIFKGVKLWQKN